MLSGHKEECRFVTGLLSEIATVRGTSLDSCLVVTTHPHGGIAFIHNFISTVLTHDASASICVGY